jgi:hypothetical protein
MRSVKIILEKHVCDLIAWTCGINEILVVKKHVSLWAIQTEAALALPGSYFILALNVLNYVH